MPANVVVVGSANLDVVVDVPRLPQLGETILGGGLNHLPGGKGLNQAVAAACAGASTSFVGAIGEDEGGQFLSKTLTDNGVNVDDLAIIGPHSGSAHILVAESGGNQIVVVPAANALVTPELALRGIAAAGPAPILVLQGEIPFETCLAAAEAATAAGGRVVFNLAPAAQVESRLFELADPLVVNEFEAGLVLDIPAPTNAEEALEALTKLLELSPTAIITLGGEGSVISDGSESRYLPAAKVEKVVDTTGAGDAFVGVLAAMLAQGQDIFSASEVATRAAAGTVGLPGASQSYSAIREVFKA